MPAPVPAGWPATGSVMTLPSVYATLPSLGTMAVSSWDVERELTGSILPGSVRAGSGVSVGSGSVAVSAVAAGLSQITPWNSTASRRIDVNGDAELFLSYDGPDAATTLGLGSWQVAPASGSIGTSGVSIDLVERQYKGRTKKNLLPAGVGWVDLAWVVAALGQQLGYYTTPPPVASAHLAASLAGGFHPEVGVLEDDMGPVGWSMASGALGPTGADFHLRDNAPFGQQLLYDTAASGFLVMNVAGTVHVSSESGNVAAQVEVRPGGVLAVRNNGASAWATTTYMAGLDPNHPTRVEIEMIRTGSAGAYSKFQARARSSATAIWSAWATSSVSSTFEVTGEYRIIVDSSSSVSGIQMTATSDPGVWVPVNADIDPLNVQALGPFLDAEVDAWSGIQQACASAIGAAWVSTDGRLTVRNRDYLAGAGIAGTLIDVGRSVEDIPWTLDPADQADRLEITYSPADPNDYVFTGTPGQVAPVVWQSPDALELQPGQTVNVVANPTSYAGLLGAWVPAWNTDLLGTGSTWSAMPNRDGTGTQPADDALTITQTQVSVGEVILTVRNNTNQVLYTVDATGQPCLILRAFRLIPQATSLTITRGADADAATNPLTIDLGKFVQRAADAEGLADFIWGRVSTPMWRASSVRIAVDWSLDIGDIVQLTHARSGLSVKALITKVAYDGSPGEVKQSIDLVLLPPTWGDFDNAWAGKTWTSFDSAWSGNTWTNFDNDPLRTGA